VMLGGISFVAVVTASIAAALVEAARERLGTSAEKHPLDSKLDEIAGRLERLEKAVDRSSPPRSDNP